MSDPFRYRHHTPITEPGRHRDLLRQLPTAREALAAAIRGVCAHYRATPGVAEERKADADARWVSAMLARLRDLSADPLTVPRPLDERFVGCCRDYALLFVAALREQGSPARIRVGFASYLHPNFHTDHVIAERWDGQRWIRTDPEMDPSSVAFDPLVVPGHAFLTAAEAWRGHRAGNLDAEAFGVAPDFMKGADIIKSYVVRELAALNGAELLLWDVWGLVDVPLAEMTETDLVLIDDVAEALAVDDEERWRALYAQHDQLRVPDRIHTYENRIDRKAVAWRSPPAEDLAL